MFELKSRDGLGRIGSLTTRHGTVETPTLLPVINPNMITIAPKEMRKKFGTSAIITNSYVINKSKGLRERALSKGVHALLDFDGPIMTDSGTFQSHVYGDVSVTNEEIVAFQRDIGSDIGSILDVFSEPFISKWKARQDIEDTMVRAEEAVEIKKKMFLAGGIQGSTYTDLREECASRMSNIDIDVNAIGGVVPLMETYKFSDLVDVVLSAKRGLSPQKPVHLYGAGHPMIFALAALMGCDMFDSSSYAKFAKDGRMMFPDGTRRAEDLVHQICHCPVCDTLTPEELSKDKVAIAEHNLYASYNEIRIIKQAIHEGSLWELVERRCSLHPDMLSALRKLREYTDYIERFEPTSKRSSFYFTSYESLHRPLIVRFNSRLKERYTPPTKGIAVVLPETSKPYGMAFRDEVAEIRSKADAAIIVESVLGPVPLELDEMYPLAQSLVPMLLSTETAKLMRKRTDDFLDHIGFEKVVRWKRRRPSNLDRLGSRPVKRDPDILKLRAVADMQFGKGAGKALIKRGVELTKSKRTGRIRSVLHEGKHLLSLRARDGLFTLKAEGATVLHKKFRRPRLRVVVQSDTAEFNREGKNVFAKFVKECDEGLRPRDEALVVNEDDELVAVARALMNREEMLAFSKGIAARVREGV
ncbi:MAG: tRNA guanosine(15) transglycosylase TgtA [Thermoplasmata archaeon]